MFCNVWRFHVCARCDCGFSRALESCPKRVQLAHWRRPPSAWVRVRTLMERIKTMLTPIRTRPTDTEHDREGPTQLGSAANVVDADLQDPQVQVPADHNLDRETTAHGAVQADDRNPPARHSRGLAAWCARGWWDQPSQEGGVEGPVSSHVG